MPRTNTEADRLCEELFAARNVEAWCELFALDDSTYVDPLFGEYRETADVLGINEGTSE